MSITFPVFDDIIGTGYVDSATYFWKILLFYERRDFQRVHHTLFTGKILLPLIQKIEFISSIGP